MSESGSEYIKIEPVPIRDRRKTKVWSVCQKEGGKWPLGFVTWFGRWRCYAFQPEPETTFEWACLRSIADFCEARTKEHRASIRARKSEAKMA